MRGYGIRGDGIQTDGKSNNVVKSFRNYSRDYFRNSSSNFSRFFQKILSGIPPKVFPRIPHERVNFYRNSLGIPAGRSGRYFSMKFSWKSAINSTWDFIRNDSKLSERLCDDCVVSLHARSPDSALECNLDQEIQKCVFLLQSGKSYRRG